MWVYQASSVAVCFVFVDVYDIYLELFLVESIIKNGSAERPKLLAFYFRFTVVLPFAASVGAD